MEPRMAQHLKWRLQDQTSTTNRPQKNLSPNIQYTLHAIFWLKPIFEKQSKTKKNITCSFFLTGISFSVPNIFLYISFSFSICSFWMEVNLDNSSWILWKGVRKSCMEIFDNYLFIHLFVVFWKNVAATRFHTGHLAPGRMVVETSKPQPLSFCVNTDRNQPCSCA